MHTFLFFSDLHWGDQLNDGFRQQDLHTDRAPQLLEALGDAAREHGADFVLCGGDLVDNGETGAIRDAAAILRRWPCPCYLATGNHDLHRPDSIREFLAQRELFFRGGDADFSFLHDGVRYDVLATRWSRRTLYWDSTGPQNPELVDAQWAMLEAGPQEPVRVIVNHVQACPLPPEQCGFAGCLTPENHFEAVADRLCARFRPALMLAGHSHLNMLVTKGTTRCVTVSALTEAPFEYKVFTFADGVFSMTTENLAERTGIPYRYDWESTYVQGRPCDRHF